MAATSDADFRAAFSIGGAPSMHHVVYGDEPYDPGVLDAQVDLRSAMLFTPSIRYPTFYFEGADSGYVDDARTMSAIGETRGVPFRAWIVGEHDHFTLVRPLTLHLADLIGTDDDVSEPFELRQEDVEMWFTLH